ncbi:LLM class flavin-dependent oxidoreductase [Nonomuraea rhizosphaerae]|uniref:LLM class flavin-dependent oxidoreductase n=1 Tax=Nonomuraea rhizosphaerae TaxID=2665663 RepID=UPI001C5F810F|nr:LLM class flavin-dependent oxidoreductase [Nonomuraea rhizosphaerae]
MRFGIFYEHQLPRPWERDSEQRLYADALEQIEIADRVGFDYVWEVEHHFLEEYSHSSAPEVFLAAASQRTSNIRLGHGIVQAPSPVNHPARVAERVATLDLVSGGRVDFGTGEASSAAELGGFGVDRERKRDMWQDSLDAVTRMFVEEPFAGWHSPYLRMPPRNVIPKTVQKPHPPLWVACSRRETIHLAARNGIGALSFAFVHPEDAGKWSRDYYRLLESEECVPAGFAVNANLAIVLPMMCHEDPAEARRRGGLGAAFFAYALAHYYGPSKHTPGNSDIWRNFTKERPRVGAQGTDPLAGALGSPQQLIDLIARYEAVGVDQMIFVLQAGPNRHEHICESLELFGKKVLPAFTEGREERERDKSSRLAPAIEAALARRSPARTLSQPYVIDEAAELARVTHRPAPSPADLLNGVRRRARLAGQQFMGRLVAGRSDEDLARWLGPRQQRVVFTLMARSFRPDKAFGFEGALEFRLLPRSTWTIGVRDGRARAFQGRARNPALTLSLPAADLVRILAGTANPASLLMSGRLEITGDVSLASRVGEMFGGASAY